MSQSHWGLATIEVRYQWDRGISRCFQAPSTQLMGQWYQTQFLMTECDGLLVCHTETDGFKIRNKNNHYD